MISDDSDAFSDGSNFEEAVDLAIAYSTNSISTADSTQRVCLPKYEEISTYNEKRIEIKNQQQADINFNLNHDNLDTIIYPTNFPLREYQYDIVLKALFENLLCAIPTGLGKTFIASTIMLNFFRWTKDGMKIIFMAPTKPLVAQQIKAFVQITGISMTHTDILLNRLKRNRKEIWDNKRVFFATPQVVENDLKSGILDPNAVALLVVDEAHRSTGNYAYSNVVKFISRIHKRFRVLALTATPGSDMQAIQNVVTNLNISSIEIRTESDPSIKKYIKDKQIEKLDCGQTPEMLAIIELLSEAILPVLEKANQMGIYDIRDPTKINHFMAMEKSQQIINNKNLSEGLKWAQYFILQLLGTVGMALRRLNIYGVHTFYNYFIEKHNEFTTKWENKKSTNRLAASFYYHDSIKLMLSDVEKMIENDKKLAEMDLQHIEGVFSHAKLKYLVDELIFFFTKNKTVSSSCIIFTEFRESALEIVKVLNNANRSIGSELLRSHIFIGQSKEKDKFDQESYLDKIKPKRKKAKIVAKSSDIRPSNRMGSSELAQSKGMNQKSQKELIENFKSGHYNILVATSIGEEGLDIGEVDLIVCFDSTQSPIKNIQRMGRTGRKRNGRVLLLFSSNERSKFEHAMGKYEWIQNQIADSTTNILKFFDPTYNRIIPDNIRPIVEKKFIELPEENMALLDDADIVDDDEFLKLATQASSGRQNKMTNKAKAGVKAKKSNKDDSRQMKLEKKFFMPKNVETGFQPVTAFVRRVDGTPKKAIQSKKAIEPLVSKALIVSKPNTTANSSTQNISIDLTVDSDDNQDTWKLPSSDEGINILKVINDDEANISANVSITKDNRAIGNCPFKVDINFDSFSDDELPDTLISQFQKRKPVVSCPPSQPVPCRSFADLSSDVFSDDIDENELIAQIEPNKTDCKKSKLDENRAMEAEQRSAKR